MSLEQALGWSLVHSVWEIAAIGAALLLFLLASRRVTAHVRYFAAVIALIACVVAPPVTLASLSSPTQHEATLPASKHRAAPHRESVPSITVSGFSPQIPRSLGQQIEPALPTVVRVWIAGLALMCMRLLGGLIGVQRLKRSGYPDADGQLQTLAEAVARRLNLERTFKLLVSDRVEVPTVIGAFKSAILLPATLTLRLAPGQIEALLAHEIAHIRRYDYLVNVLQSAIEAVLFYHPAVWWISSIVRREREHCCDDIAIEGLGDRIAYTRALISLEDARSPRLTLAATGGGLMSRVRRIAGAPQAAQRVSGSGVTVCLIALVLCSLIAQAANSKQASSVPEIHVTGQVVSAEGRPVAGAVVDCSTVKGIQFPAQRQRQTTDAEGRYDFQVEKSASSTLTAGSSRYGVGWTFGDPILKLIPPSPARVVVVDRNGRPVPHLKLVPTLVEAGGSGVPLSGLEDIYGFETDERGVATLNDLPAYCKARFDVVGGRYAIDQSPEYLLKGKLSRIVVQPATPLSGTVMAEGKPVNGAVITAYSEQKPVVRRTTTDAEGRFLVQGFPAGPAVIHAYISVTWAVSPKRLFVSRDRANDVPFMAQRTGTLSGKVLDEAGKPLSKTYLLVYQGTPFDHTNVASANSGTDGSFSVRLAPGPYEVMAITDKARGTQKFTVQSDQSTSVTLRIPKPSPKAQWKNVLCKLVDPSGHPVHWKTFWFIFKSADSQSVELCKARDQGTAEVSGPAALQPPVTFHCEDKHWESDEMTWPAGAMLVIHLHPKRKTNR